MSKVAQQTKVYINKGEYDALVQSMMENDRQRGYLRMWSPFGKKEVKTSWYETQAFWTIAQTWWWRNPESGFIEFYLDTPEWVIELNQKYGSFRSRGNEIQFKEKI